MIAKPSHRETRVIAYILLGHVCLFVCSCLSGLLLGIGGSHAARTRRVGVARSDLDLLEVG